MLLVDGEGVEPSFPAGKAITLNSATLAGKWVNKGKVKAFYR